jgi:DNA-binding response OmpR family regulator
MPSILVVEDEIELGRLLTRELEAAGYGVRHAPNGHGAAPDGVQEAWRQTALPGTPLQVGD